jgi:hypothetical protein
MDRLYGRIMAQYKNTPEDPMAMLLRCLACIVYHSESILATMFANPGHDFSKILILHADQVQLHDLRLLVTTEPTPEVMATPTRIPPHVELASQLKEILNNVTKVVTSLQEQTTRITEAVKTAIDEKSWDLGHVTGTRLREILTTFQDQSMDAVNTRLGSTRADFNRVAGGGGDGGGGGGDEEEDNLNNFGVGGEEREGTRRQPGSTTFAYDGHFFDVPQDFCFPR